jgi:hypothetical protein
MSEAILAWHFLSDGARMRDGKTIATAGLVCTVEPPLIPCKNGLHGSIRPSDALQYAPGAWVQRVQHSGEIVRDDDKLCSTVRKSLWIADAARTLHEFAIWCAEETPLADGRMSGALLTDHRSLNALRVKRLWLDGKATDEELAAAWAAACDAQNAELEIRLLALGPK